MKGLLMALLLLPTLAEATITVTARGTTQSNASSSTTFAIAPTSGNTLSAGNYGIMTVSADNVGSGTLNMPTSITDSQGNVWTRQRENVSALSSGLGVDLGTYWSYITTTLSSTDNITLTFTSAVTAKCAALWEVSCDAANVMLFNLGANAIQNANASPSTTTTQAVSNGCLIIGVGGSEQADNWVADTTNTTNGSWSTSQHTAAGTGTGGMSLITQYKVVTATGAQTYGPTISTGTPDDVTQIMQFSEVDNHVYGMQSNVTSEATSNLVVRRAIPAGALGVLVLATDNNGSSPTSSDVPATTTDDAVNTWTRQANRVYNVSGQNTGAELSLWTGAITTSLAVGQNVNVTWSANSMTAKAWIIWAFSPVGSGTVTYSDSGTAAGSSTASPTVTTNSVNAGDRIIGGGAAAAIDSWSGVSGWSRNNHLGFATTTAAGMAAQSQYLTQTSTGTQTYNPTQSGADPVIVGWISIHDSSPVITNTSSGFLEFFP